jgi:hypothetical protein
VSFLLSDSNLFFASEYNSFERVVPAPVVFSTTYIIDIQIKLHPAN